MILDYLERQVSYFFQATLPLKQATIALKIGHLAFQVCFCSSSKSRQTVNSMFRSDSVVVKLTPGVCKLSSFFDEYVFSGKNGGDIGISPKLSLNNCRVFKIDFFLLLKS